MEKDRSEELQSSSLQLLSVEERERGEKELGVFGVMRIGSRMGLYMHSCLNGPFTALTLNRQAKFLNSLDGLLH